MPMPALSQVVGLFSAEIIARQRISKYRFVFCSRFPFGRICIFFKTVSPALCSRPMLKVKPISPLQIAQAIGTAPEFQSAYMLTRDLSQKLKRSKACSYFSLRTLWICGHLASVVGIVWQIWSEWGYRVACCGAIVTYSVSMLRMKPLAKKPVLSGKLTSENGVLFLTAALHLATAPNVLKIAGFACYSTINLWWLFLHELLVNQFTLSLVPAFEYTQPAIVAAAAHLDFAVVFVYIWASWKSGLWWLALFCAHFWIQRMAVSAVARKSYLQAVGAVQTGVHVVSFRRRFALVEWMFAVAKRGAEMEQAEDHDD